MPPNTGDDSIHRLARCYRQNRLPVITWRHPRNKALLLRGASFHGKGVMSMLKGPPTTTGTNILLGFFSIVFEIPSYLFVNQGKKKALLKNDYIVDLY